MARPERAQITGLVLAGGRGVRMGGVDKGWVLHDGEPLVKAVLRRLAPQVGSILISANRNVDAYRALADVVTDADIDLSLEAFPGPLAGVLAGLRRAGTDWIALAPCDAPALPAGLVDRLADAVDDAVAAYPVAAGRSQPVFALLRRSAAVSLAAYLQDGGRAMHRWLDSVGAIAVSFDDPAAFRNINEPTGFAPARSAPSE